MTTKTKVLLGALTVLVSYAFGYYFAPYKTKTVTITVEKKTTDEETQKQKHKKTTITETTAPDGSKTKTTQITDDEGSKTDIAQIDDVSKSETREVTKSSRTVNLSFMAGIPLSFGAITPVYGGAATTSLIGPITIGAWGLSNATIGMSLGLNL